LKPNYLIQVVKLSNGKFFQWGHVSKAQIGKQKGHSIINLTNFHASKEEINTFGWKNKARRIKSDEYIVYNSNWDSQRDSVQKEANSEFQHLQALKTSYYVFMCDYKFGDSTMFQDCLKSLCQSQSN